MEQSEYFSDRVAGILKKLAFFSEREAWTYFRAAAFGEAIGWTILISGILISRYVMHGSNTAVAIAGQIHGTIFLIYVALVFVACTSLKWTKRQTIIAALASIPPYGTLVFEKWAAHKRRREAETTHRQIVVRAIIISNKQLLVIQPRDSGFWCLPGGNIGPHESTEQALTRLIIAQLGVAPHIGPLRYVLQYKHRGTERLEFFFLITNAKDFKNLTAQTDDIDEVEFITLQPHIDLEPQFLLQEQLSTILKENDIVKFIRV